MDVAFTIPSTALAITLPSLVAKLEGKREEALRLAVEQGLQQGISVSELQLRMILPAQRELGRLWEENQISVAQELHFPSLRDTVAAVRTRFPTLPILVGGGLLEGAPELGRELDVQAFGRTADELARLGSELLGCAGHPFRRRASEGKETGP